MYIIYNNVEFSKFKGFGKRILKNIGYNADSKDLKKISE